MPKAAKVPSSIRPPARRRCLLCRRLAPCICREEAAGGLVAGVDEAGRGPLAGPVVAAAVILPAQGRPRGIADSKQVGADEREALFRRIKACAAVGVGVASVDEIDALNILQASLLAMRRALDALDTVPALVLVDGNIDPRCGLPCQTLVDGDALSVSVAAASIVAKVTRDRLMSALAAEFPQYGWAANKGYGTPEHRRALAAHGPTPHHRRSFAPVAMLDLALGQEPQAVMPAIGRG
jgi:ribonuclease HII